MSDTLRRLSLFIFFCLFCSCSNRELISGLTQKESTETLLALSSQGIKAEREKVAQASGNGESFKINVSDGDFSRALEIVRQLGFPKETDPRTKVFLEKSGLIPDPPQTMAARLDLLRAAEIERYFGALPQIFEAKAIVNIERAKEQQLPQSLSLLLVTEPIGNASTADKESEYRAMLTQLVSEVAPERVSIAFKDRPAIPQDTLVKKESVTRFAFPFSFRVVALERERALSEILMFFSMFLILGAIVGFFGGLFTRESWRFSLYQKKRQQRKSGVLTAVPKGANRAITEKGDS